MFHPAALAARAMLVFVTTIPAFGCGERTDDYIAVSSISNNGFAMNESRMLEAEGREIRLWGFVDHGNMYGDAGAKRTLEEWWSGDGPRAASWGFNLKGKAYDQAGHSFPVRVPNDKGRDALLGAFVADARSQRPTKVFVKGRIFTFHAPMNYGSRVGLYMEVQSSRDILLDVPQGR
jgi:hypothetical protein